MPVAIFTTVHNRAELCPAKVQQYSYFFNPLLLLVWPIKFQSTTHQLFCVMNNDNIKPIQLNHINNDERPGIIEVMISLD